MVETAVGSIEWPKACDLHLMTPALDFAGYADLVSIPS